VCYKHLMSATPVQLPSSVGRYRISAHLFGDAVGDVYKGFDPLIERPVVVRVFRLQPTDPAADAALKQNFYSEMQRAGVLMHYGIATLFDAGELPGALFMANEYVEATSLAALLDGPLDPDVPMQVSLIAQIVDALEYAREQGVPHLGLRPSNVLVSSDYSVKLGGFGVAPVVEALAAASGQPSPAPARYTAPELARGEAGDCRSDVFSLARIALDVLSSTGPASTGAPESVPPLPLRLAEYGVSADRWLAVFDRALADDPADRFETPGEFEVELLLTLGTSAGEARMSRNAAMASGDSALLPRLAHAAPNTWEVHDDATVMASEPATTQVARVAHDEMDPTSDAAFPETMDAEALKARAASRIGDQDTQTAESSVVPRELAPDEDTGVANPKPRQATGPSKV
jgi:serine/threonine protein kinase